MTCNFKIQAVDPGTLILKVACKAWGGWDSQERSCKWFRGWEVGFQVPQYSKVACKAWGGWNGQEGNCMWFRPSLSGHRYIRPAVIALLAAREDAEISAELCQAVGQQQWLQ